MLCIKVCLLCSLHINEKLEAGVLGGGIYLFQVQG